MANKNKNFIAENITQEAEESRLTKNIENATGTTKKGRPSKEQTMHNIGFSADNIEYLRTMSRVKGISVTEFVNEIVADHIATHGDVYQQIKELVKNI